MSKYYAVAIGRESGIFRSWDRTKAQVSGYPGAIHKSFRSEEEAIVFLRENSTDSVAPTVPITSPPKPVPITSPSNSTPILKNILKIYTDGSCDDKYGGYGIVVCSNGTLLEQVSGPIDSYPTTNNVSELTALLTTMQKIPEWISTHFQDIPKPSIQIYSDSMYSIKCMNVWIHKWYRNGWKTATGNPVKNKDLVRSLWEEYQKRMADYSIKINHVYAHRGHKWNELADSLASQGRPNY